MDAHPPTCRAPEARHLGVVMVHGVGFQRPGDILLQWTRPLERALRGWAESRSLPIKPSVAASVGLELGDERLVELQLPEQPPRTPGATWHGTLHVLVTEALWAPFVKDPSTSDVSAWLGEHGAAGRLAEGTLGLRGGSDVVPGQSNLYEDEGESEGQVPAQSSVAALRNRIREVRRNPRAAAQTMGHDLLLGFNRLRVAVVASGFASVLLLVWAALRGIARLIPFAGGLVNRADRLLTGTAGHMHTLIDDPAQAANVRSRIANAVTTLRAYGCDRVVLVAHSAGALASHTTLNDPSYAEMPVDGLISFGQGLNAAWDLTNVRDFGGCEVALQNHGLVVADPRRGRAYEWDDFWASDDPVPSGPLRFPVCTSGHVDRDHGRLWNRASSGADHSTYWLNDEEFVMPVLSRLADLADLAGGSGPITWEHHGALIERRQRRVSLQALWRRLAFVALPVTVVLSFTRPGFGGLDDLGATVTRIWNSLPLHELISGPVAAYQSWAAEVVLPTPLGSALVTLGGVLFVAVASLIGASVAVPFGRWGPWRSSPRLARGLAWLDIGAGASLFVVSAIVVGPAFILPVIIIILGSTATLMAQRIQERSTGKETRQMWALTIVYAAGFGAFFLSWGSVFAIPLAGQILIGIGVVYAILLAIRGIGIWVWASWDRYERWQAVRDRVPRTEGRFIAGEGGALVAALVAVVLGVSYAGEEVAGIPVTSTATIAVIGLAALVVLTAAARASLRSTA